MNYSTLTVTNSTLSGNKANSDGGGINNSNNGTLTVTNSTLSGNSANFGGGIYNRPNNTVKAKNTIIAKNTASNNPDFSGNLTSQGYNLIGTTTTGTITGDTTGNIINSDPKLDTLKDNGGSTQTMALFSDSPAFDAGDPNFTSPPDRDQRGTGYSRVINGKIDIGAFEANFG